MTHDYLLSFKPCMSGFGDHDPSAAIFRDGQLMFAIEQERLSRRKHAVGEFPEEAIRACLRHCDIAMADVDTVLLPYDPRTRWRLQRHRLKKITEARGIVGQLYRGGVIARQSAEWTLFPTRRVEQELRRRFGCVPEVATRGHHRCHAASAYFPSGFDEALVVTVDGLGDYEGLAIWLARGEDLQRVHTVRYPNSLGIFYAVATGYLGFRPFNGEYKVMGLAAYGSPDAEIRRSLDARLTRGRNFSVGWLAEKGIGVGIERFEALLGRERREGGTESFDSFYENVAHEVQAFLEETITEIVSHYCGKFSVDRVAMAGGVALNCKMNQRLRALSQVGDLFVQPASHDAGLALGAGYLASPDMVRSGQPVYLGPSYNDREIERLLDRAKLSYSRMDDVELEVARRLAQGEIVGRFEGKLEFGPRALGNRSILADPRSNESRDRVNRHVKDREGWRPFAPAMTVEAGRKYLKDFRVAPYMVETFDVTEAADQIEGVLHPADRTTRPQIVTADMNPRFHRLIEEFGRRTGVEAVLNTSFNDHGEPIVCSPKEAVKDFFVMGLDALAVGPYLVEK